MLMHRAGGFLSPQMFLPLCPELPSDPADVRASRQPLLTMQAIRLSYGSPLPDPSRQPLLTMQAMHQWSARCVRSPASSLASCARWWRLAGSPSRPAGPCWAAQSAWVPADRRCRRPRCACGFKAGMENE